MAREVAGDVVLDEQRLELLNENSGGAVLANTPHGVVTGNPEVVRG